ncbi:M61 family metallopeptidase [Neptunitalea lumnitzerae]|uniref:Peptidase M61 n=1 Tax=Neptunitalea lumnitzerae TaxID=2965509 RepID=A0ABQ5MHQ7_9FLAO|nr:peptidase M61 [Neptunitalea sp. Y10]GLB48938.1 peptidase M61 [Neptunitalea sp. Y10]
MKKLALTLFSAGLIFSCTPKVNDLATETPVKATIDLTNVKDDKVMSTIDPGRFTEESVTFYIPKTVPGTYSADNYGQFIEDFKAYDYNGKELAVSKPDVNSWVINNATKLDKITFWVNDTFDSESGASFVDREDVFSPSGTNILEGQNFFLNLHMFVGYFKGLDERPYELTFKHPAEFKASTSLESSETPSEDPTTDVFYASRYFEVTDNPIMYSKLDQAKFKVNDIEVTLSVYSPTGAVKASDLKEAMQTMMQAQKTFLGEINSTKSYDILLYLSTMKEDDAKGFGALEHHTSTTVVMPEAMGIDQLKQSLTDIVSHEFFHIVAPLTIHSDEIQYFDYYDPQMSEHLWMYEGTTEYFANLFQINQGLITEEEFYSRLLGKINNSQMFDDNMSFTVMSKNVLDDPYKKNYANVYEKGALISMCLDIIIREESNGEKGILWLMKQLSTKYGMHKSFKDEEIIAEVTNLTYPAVGEFIEKYVVGANNPIPYNDYFAKVGLEPATQEVDVFNFFLMDQQTPYIDANPEDKTIYFRDGIELNTAITALGIKGGDVIKSINGTEYTLDNVQQMIISSFGWTPGDEIEMVVVRDGEEVTLKGTYVAPKGVQNILKPADDATEAQTTLRNAWLKN